MEPRPFDVKNCPRCGEDHPQRNFFYRTDAHGVEVHPVWWSLCPVEGETLALAKDRDGVERVVKID